MTRSSLWQFFKNTECATSSCTKIKQNQTITIPSLLFKTPSLGIYGYASNYVTSCWRELLTSCTSRSARVTIYGRTGCIIDLLSGKCNATLTTYVMTLWYPRHWQQISATDTTGVWQQDKIRGCLSEGDIATGFVCCRFIVTEFKNNAFVECVYVLYSVTVSRFTTGQRHKQPAKISTFLGQHQMYTDTALLKE